MRNRHLRRHAVHHIATHVSPSGTHSRNEAGIDEPNRDDEASSGPVLLDHDLQLPRTVLVAKITLHFCLPRHLTLEANAF